MYFKIQTETKGRDISVECECGNVDLWCLVFESDEKKKKIFNFNWSFKEE